MKFYLAIAVLFVVVVSILAFVLRTRHHRSDGPGGFRDWVKNPAYRKAVEEHWTARDSVTVPDDISDAEIQALVQGLFLSEDEDFNQERLKLVGSKAVPHLIDALADTVAVTARFPEGGHVIDAKSPFERICNLLESLHCPEAVAPLARFVDHADADIRKATALTLASIGTATAADAVIRLLADDDDYVRSYAMMGIERSIQSKRRAPEFLDTVFPALVALLDRKDGSVSGRAPELLLLIDQERALPLLLSAEYFSTTNCQLQYILSALNRVEHPIPHDKLLPLLDKLAPLANEYPHSYAYAEALIAFARNPDPTTEAHLRETLSSPTDEVREGAAKALQIFHNIDDPWAFVCQRIDEVGWDDLSVPQKLYIAVSVYNGEVNNGGHAQYFFNSGGNDYEWVLEGLQAIGASKRAAILAEVVNLFGPSGPSTDREERQRQLARMSPKQDAHIDQSDQDYYGCDENVSVLLARYTIENPSHFTETE